VKKPRAQLVKNDKCVFPTVNLGESHKKVTGQRIPGYRCACVRWLLQRCLHDVTADGHRQATEAQGWWTLPPELPVTHWEIWSWTEDDTRRRAY